jgi:hypothetical protein
MPTVSGNINKVKKKNQTRSGGGGDAADSLKAFWKSSDAQFAAGVSGARKRKKSAKLQGEGEEAVKAPTMKKLRPKQTSAVKKNHLNQRTDSVIITEAATSKSTTAKTDVTPTAASDNVMALKSAQEVPASNASVLLNGKASPQSVHVVKVGNKAPSAATTFAAVLLNGKASPQSVHVVKVGNKAPSAATTFAAVTTTPSVATTFTTIAATPSVASVSGSNHNSAAKIVSIVEAMGAKKATKVRGDDYPSGCGSYDSWLVWNNLTVEDVCCVEVDMIEGKYVSCVCGSKISTRLNQQCY